MRRPLLIVSGGAESVSLTVAEWAISRSYEVHVISLVARSLLEGIDGLASFTEVEREGDRAHALDVLRVRVRALAESAGRAVLAFPTEDDSLGLLLELQRLYPGMLLVSRCRALVSGGLDKNEVHRTLVDKGLEHLLAPSRAIRRWDDVAECVSEWGHQIVLKPTHKPWARNLGGGAKLYRHAELSRVAVREEIEADLDAGRTWLAQPVLQPIEGFERSACVVRGGGILYAEVAEVLKFPVRGGSACWVRTQPGSTLLRDATRQIVDALDLEGMAEIAFLAGPDGSPKLLEINPRPWLQLQLMLDAGFDLLRTCSVVLEGGQVDDAVVEIARRDWISLERVLLKLATGDGSRGATARALPRALGQRVTLSVWSTQLPRVRMKWMRRMLGRLAS